VPTLLEEKDYLEEARMEHCSPALTDKMDKFLRHSMGFLGVKKRNGVDNGSPIKMRLRCMKKERVMFDGQLSRVRSEPALGATQYLTEGPHEDAPHVKYLKYASRPSGNFPHPTKAGTKGLPFMPECDRQIPPGSCEEGLPSNFLKPCVNTSACHYNDFRDAKDRYEHKQRELNHYIKEQHRSNREAFQLLTPVSKRGTDKALMHATTKPLGRLYFDRSAPQFRFSDKTAKLLLPEGYERQTYSFWK